MAAGAGFVERVYDIAERWSGRNRGVFTRLKPLISSCAALLLGASLANASDNPNGLNVLVVAMQHGGQGVIAPVKERISQAVVGKLIAEGHRVFDDLVIRGTRTTTDNRKAILTAIGERATRENAPRYDVLVLVMAELTHVKGTYTSSYAVRLTGSLVDPNTGHYLADPTTTATSRRRIPDNCAANCLTRLGAQQVEASAATLGATIARNLARLSHLRRQPLVSALAREPSHASKIMVFQGFEAVEISDIKEYLMVMPGFTGLAPVPGNSGRLIYRFKKFEGHKGLERSLQALLAHMQLAAKIKNQTGKAFMIEALPKGPQSKTATNDW